MKWLKALHARAERARVRSRLATMEKEADRLDYCGDEDCLYCHMTNYIHSPDAGPNEECYPDDWKSID